MSTKPPPPSSFIKVGYLRKTGQPFGIIRQGVRDIDGMLALQQEILDGMDPAEKTFIVPKTRDFFEKHLASGNIVLGVIADGRLIAQCVIVNPTRENPKTGMTDMAARIRPEKMSIIQGILVSEAYRGNRLMTEMVDVWLDIARKEGRRHAVAEVASDNHFSWTVFMREGLSIHSIGYDRLDALYLYNMHADVDRLIEARLTPAFNGVASRPGRQIACDKADIKQQKKLTRKGFEGVSFLPKDQKILFVGPEKRQLSATVKRIATRMSRWFR